MSNHKIIDTSQLKKGKFTFSGLTEKTKNQLMIGGLSFAGVLTVVGLSRFFISEDGSPTPPSNSSLDSSSELDSNVLGGEPLEEIVEAIPTEESYDDAYEAMPEEVIEDAYYTISFDSDASFAEGVNDEMTFPTAFITAREEVGMGGFFNWKDNSYSTYTEEEWNAMSQEDQQSFYNDVSSKSDMNVEAWTIEEETIPSDSVDQNEEITIDQASTNANPIVEQADEIEAIDLELLESEEGPSLEPQNLNEPTSSETVETITIVPPAAYGSGDMNADNVVDAIVIDNNDDGNADLVALDEDFDGVYETFMINEDGDEDLDVFIIDQGGDGIDDTDQVEEISDVVDMEDFIVIDEDDSALEGLDFIDDLIDLDQDDEMESEEDTASNDQDFDAPGL